MLAVEGGRKSRAERGPGRCLTKNRRTPDQSASTIKIHTHTRTHKHTYIFSRLNCTENNIIHNISYHDHYDYYDSFERLVLTHLKDITGPLLAPCWPPAGPLLAPCWPPCSWPTGQMRHWTQGHLFVDCSSAFITIIPGNLQPKLPQLSVPASTCQWITHLTDRQEAAGTTGKHLSSTRAISTGAPQGSVLSPLLFTNDCTSGGPSVKLLKFTDDTAVIGLIRVSLRTDGRWNSPLVWSEQPGDSGLQEEPPNTAPPHHTQQHCVCSGDLQVSGIHNLPGSKVGLQHQHHPQKGPAKDVPPAPPQEVQPA